MPTDPYAAPKGHIVDRSSPVSPTKSVLIGLAIAVIGPIFCFVLVALVVAVVFPRDPNATELTAEQITRFEVMEDALNIVRWALAALAGFVCTRLARRSDYRLGLVVATVPALVQVASIVVFDVSEFNVVALAASFAFVLVGARLAMHRPSR